MKTVYYFSATRRPFLPSSQGIVGLCSLWIWLAHILKPSFVNWVVVAEWLRRWTRNPLGSPRAGSSPADNAKRFFFLPNAFYFSFRLDSGFFCSYIFCFPFPSGYFCSYDSWYFFPWNLLKCTVIDPFRQKYFTRAPFSRIDDNETCFIYSKFGEPQCLSLVRSTVFKLFNHWNSEQFKFT